MKNMMVHSTMCNHLRSYRTKASILYKNFVKKFYLPVQFSMYSSLGKRKLKLSKIHTCMSITSFGKFNKYEIVSAPWDFLIRETKTQLGDSIFIKIISKKFEIPMIFWMQVFDKLWSYPTDTLIHFLGSATFTITHILTFFMQSTFFTRQNMHIHGTISTQIWYCNKLDR